MARLITVGFVVALLVTGAVARTIQAPERAQSGTITLKNARLAVGIAAGRLQSIADTGTGEVVRFADAGFSVIVNGRRYDERAPTAPPQVDASHAIYTYDLSDLTVTVTYELRVDWGFVSKQIRITPKSASVYRVDDIHTLAAGISPDFDDRLPLSDGRFGMLLRLPSRTPNAEGSSVYLLHQNPYNTFTVSGSSVDASYRPDMDWTPSDGAFEADRLLVGVVRRDGRRVPDRSVAEWVQVADYDRYVREHPSIDTAESAALVDAVRAFLITPAARSVRVHVPWCENDYQIDVATPAGWTEYQRILDMAAKLGLKQTLFTGTNSALATLAENRDAWGWENLLFFGLGQRIRKGEWIPGRDPVPPALQQMIDAGKSRGLGYMAYAYPTLPFLQNPAWTAWAGRRLGGTRGVDTGQRSFQDWWIDTLTRFVSATGASGFSFDHWWINYDDPAATSLYAQWYGARRILETLRRRVPDIVIDGRQQYMNFGPWTWLGGSYPHPTLTDEQPESFVAFPDLHTDRVSADRQRFAAWKYRVERFAPPELIPGFIGHQTERSDERNVMRRDTFRTRDWDVLGWKYSLLSSIGTAPFNHTVSMIPARDEAEFKAFSAADQAFFRRWLDWTDTNAAILRHLRPIIGPPMLGRADGTAAIAGDHGFMFLFNPNYSPVDAVVPLDATSGVTAGSSFVLKEIYPRDGRLIGKPAAGVWRRGDEARVTLGANEAVVLELLPAPALIQRPLLFDAIGSVALNGDALVVSGLSGEPGTTQPVRVLLPTAQPISRVTVNGEPTRFSVAGRVVETTVAFAGMAFTRGQSVFDEHASTSSTLTASVTVPARVMRQLADRQAWWPVPYTEDDLRATWLGSSRLLLFVQVAEPDPSLPITLSIDGRTVALQPAYNSIYPHSPRRTFVGFYADVSSLAPDVPHRIALTLPQLLPGRFRGLFFENVEPEWTTAIRTAR